MLNQVLKESKGLGGLNNYSSSDKWDRLFRLDLKGRKLLYMKVRLSAKVVVNLRKLKGHTSLDLFVRKNKSKFLK